MKRFALREKLMDELAEVGRQRQLRDFNKIGKWKKNLTIQFAMNNKQ